MNRHNLLKTLALSSIVIVLGSCAVIQKLTCNSSNAKRNGQEDAANGRIEYPNRNGGESCQGEYTASQFVADYNAGFEEQKNKMCQITEVAKMAKADGDAAANIEEGKKKLNTCKSTNQYRSLIANYEKLYFENYCGTDRAQKVGEQHGKAMSSMQYATSFAGCEKYSTLKANVVYEASYNKAYKEAQIAKQAEFVKTTGTSSFQVAQKRYTAICKIPADQSQVIVTVTNPNPDKALIQGQWSYQYFDKNFNRIADDTSSEAVLLTGNSSKTFTKMTLPRDASFCRAEYATSVIQ